MLVKIIMTDFKPFLINDYSSNEVRLLKKKKKSWCTVCVTVVVINL